MADTHVKIYAVTPRVQYVANGSTTNFPYNFAIFDETNMQVYKDGVLLDSGYSVNGVGEDDGGSVVFVSAPEADSVITLVRNVPIERVTDFQEGGAFRPKNINDDLDRLTAFCQQLQETSNRTLKLPVTGGVASILDLPTPNPGKTIIWNDEGTGLTNSNETIDDIVARVAEDPNFKAVGQDLNSTPSNIKQCAQNLDAIAAAPLAASSALNSSRLAKQWAIGDPSEPEGSHSARYYAEQASAVTEVYPATEERQGIAMLATTDDAETGTDDEKIITPKKAVEMFKAQFTGLTQAEYDEEEKVSGHLYYTTDTHRLYVGEYRVSGANEATSASGYNITEMDCGTLL